MYRNYLCWVLLVFILCNCVTIPNPSTLEPVRITVLTKKASTPPTPVIRTLISESWVKKYGPKIMDFGIKHLKPEVVYGRFDDQTLNIVVDVIIEKGFLKLPDFKNNASAYFIGDFIPTIICIERGNLKKIVSNVDIKLREDLFQIFRTALAICLAPKLTVIKARRKYRK
jgi:hypothetical protein